MRDPLDSFCVFILTHRRPDKQITYKQLKKSGYTGRTYFVVDDQDPTLPEYKRKYGDQVLVFSKAKLAGTFDEAITNSDRRTTSYPRNAMWDLASQVGCKYFCQLDDDYTSFHYRLSGPQTGYHAFRIKNLDLAFAAMVRFMQTTPTTSIAMSQGGEHMGGSKIRWRVKRKAMNSFVCDVERPFLFVGKLNEDVNTYLTLGNKGHLFFTHAWLMLVQVQTQASAGGMTEAYKASGTYVKSFYSIMFLPSAVKVTQMGTSNPRLHHSIDWNLAVPKIVRETVQKHG